MTLLVMIDDATSKVVARFAPAESTEGYFDLLSRCLRKHGRPMAIYTDRHSIFWGESRTGDPQPGQTQFAVEAGDCATFFVGVCESAGPSKGNQRHASPDGPRRR